MEWAIRYGGAINVPGYDCRIMNKTFEEWQNMGTSSPIFGGFLVIYGIITMILYILELYVIIRSGLMKHPCYIIMVHLACMDFVAVFFGGFTSGIFYIYRITYCMYPNFVYFTGGLATACWNGSCLTCLLLVTNRVLDLSNPMQTAKFFSPKLTPYVLIIPTVYCLAVFMFNAPLIFTSPMPFHGWYYNPFLGGDPETFINYLDTFNNFGVVALIVGLYVYLSYVMLFRLGSDLSRITGKQKSILLQSCLISLANLGAAMIYMSTMWITIPSQYLSYFQIVGTVFWISGHSIPAYIYIIFNTSVRQLVWKLIRRKQLFTKVTAVQSSSL